MGRTGMRRARRTQVGIGFLAVFLAASAGWARGEIAPVLHGTALVQSQDASDFAPAKDGARVTVGSGVRAAPGTAASLDIAKGVSIRLGTDAVMALKPNASLP